MNVADLNSNIKLLSWRDVLPVHAAAELLPLMSPEGQRDLGRDIRVNGLQAPVVVYVDPEGGRFLLDGRNRLDGMEYVALPVVKDGALDPGVFQEVKDVDPVAYTFSANLHRRHLSAKDKREAIGKLLSKFPDRSDRQVAALLAVSHHTVANVRKELEGRGQIAHVKTRTDTRGRRQPAAKSVAAEPKPEARADALDAVKEGQASAPAANTKNTKTADPVTTLSAAADEIADQVRDIRGLLHHPHQHMDTILKKLARIASLAERYQKIRGAKAGMKSNATIDLTLLPHALSLDKQIKL